MGDHRKRGRLRCAGALIPPSVVLETDRVRLRQFHPSDEAALVHVFDDAYARRFYPDMADMAAARCWIAKNLESMVHPENYASMGVARRIHQHTRRFERLGDLYHLFYTERSEWLGEGPRS